MTLRLGPPPRPQRRHPGGISSGAALAATLTVAKRPDTPANDRDIMPSFAERYISTALFEEA